MIFFLNQLHFSRLCFRVYFATKHIWLAGIQPGARPEYCVQLKKRGLKR